MNPLEDQSFNNISPINLFSFDFESFCKSPRKFILLQAITSPHCIEDETFMENINDMDSDNEEKYEIEKLLRSTNQSENSQKLSKS